MQPNTKMSSGQATFDLKAARQMCDRYTSWKTLNLHPECEPRCVSDAARELPAALDEIERQANRIAELEADLEYYKSGFHSERGVHERVAAILGTDDAPWMLAQRAIERIAKLEILLGVARKDEEWVANKFGAKIDKQRAALKKLGQAKRERGKALVEERAKRLVADRGDCPYRSPIKNQLISRCDKGIICDWCQCPIKDEWRDEAREQLVHEGKL